MVGQLFLLFMKLYIRLKDKLAGNQFIVELDLAHPNHFNYCNSTLPPFHVDGVIYDNLFAVMQNLCWELVDNRDEDKIRQFYSNLF